MDQLLPVAAGVALAAACGFRVFVPLLVAGLAARAGHLPLSPGFAWLASDPALLGLAVATVAEVVAYAVPWLDHLLDTLATPVAVAAGVLVSAALFVDLPAPVRWGAAVVLGGGAAGAVQAGSVLARLKSGVLTGGAANPFLAGLELLGALAVSATALLAPLLLLVALPLGLVLAARRARRRRATPGGAPP